MELLQARHFRKTKTNILVFMNIQSFDFDTIVDRLQTNTVKFGFREALFGSTDVIPLWVADMDFETPHFVVEAVKKRAEHPIYGYTFRADSFYNSFIDWVGRRHGWQVSRNQLIFTPGVVPALYLAITSLTEPNDKIIVQPPVYTPFSTTIKSNNRQLVENPLIQKNGKQTIDFDDLQKKIEDGAKMLLLCSPHNPGGRVWTEEELRRLADICIANEVIVVSDEIHSDLVYKPHKHIPFASLSDSAAAHTITCMAPSKTFNAAGLATAILVAGNPELHKKLTAAMEGSHLFTGNLFGAVALEAAYTHGDRWLEQLLSYLNDNIEFVCRFFNERIPQIKPYKPEGTYLMWLDCAGLGMNDKQLMSFMTSKAKVGMNAGTQFGTGGEGFLRLNVASPRSIIQQALLQIENAVIEIEN